MDNRFIKNLAVSWFAGYLAAVALVAFSGRPADESGVPFVAAWAAVYSVPLAFVTVLPAAFIAWNRRLPIAPVLLTGIVVGSLPGIIPYVVGKLSHHQPPLVGTGDTGYLIAAVVGAVVGSTLFALAVRRKWRAA